VYDKQKMGVPAATIIRHHSIPRPQFSIMYGKNTR
jgi:hypothetical protein